MSREFSTVRFDFQRRAYFWKYRVETRFKRFCRAWCYATGTLSAGEAQTIIVECLDPAGWYPLMILTVEDALARAREIFADHPELPSFIAEGCEKVGRKWENFGDELQEAINWAIENAEEYAAKEGIIFVRIADGDADGAESRGEE
ncbi:hypothetical protein [Acidocella facilis]|jgi:hypothetical protein|uniref:hypothetical protein n=1 Tax=Acidocella facilis TaxID=525 RepID=UPI001F266241|nr:hypothetical protein [Acidocella facilis]